MSPRGRPDAHFAAEAIRSRPGARSERCSQPTELDGARSSERGTASPGRAAGSIHPRFPGAGGPACLLDALYFTLRSCKGFRFTPGIGSFAPTGTAAFPPAAQRLAFSQPTLRVSKKRAESGAGRCRWHSKSEGEGAPAGGSSPGAGDRSLRLPPCSGAPLPAPPGATQACRPPSLPCEDSGGRGRCTCPGRDRPQ